jgi:hypothetical protein
LSAIPLIDAKDLMLATLTRAPFSRDGWIFEEQGTSPPVAFKSMPSKGYYWGSVAFRYRRRLAFERDSGTACDAARSMPQIDPLPPVALSLSKWRISEYSGHSV